MRRYHSHRVAQGHVRLHGQVLAYPTEARLPHDHPALLAYGKGVSADGRVHEVGIAPRPLQAPDPALRRVHEQSAHSAVLGACRREAHHHVGQHGVLRPLLDVLPRRGGAPRPERPRWGGGRVGRLPGACRLHDEAEAWAEDCLWYWKTWCVPYGRSLPPMLVGDADTVSRSSRRSADTSRRTRCSSSSARGSWTVTGA